MPRTFQPNCTYRLGDGSGLQSLVHLLRAVEASERGGAPLLPERPEIEPLAIIDEIERLPIDDDIAAILEAHSQFCG